LGIVCKPRLGIARAGCEWKRVIGCTRFDTIKVWATGDRYAILSGETFKRFRGLP
jgi:hypothetical protein